MAVDQTLPQAQDLMGELIESAAIHVKNIAFDAYNRFIQQVQQKQLELEPEDLPMYCLPKLYERRWGVAVRGCRVYYIDRWDFVQAFRSSGSPIKLEKHLLKFHPELAKICRRAEREFERARLLTLWVKTMRPLVAKMQKLPTGLATAA